MNTDRQILKKLRGITLRELSNINILIWCDMMSTIVYLSLLDALHWCRPQHIKHLVSMKALETNGSCYHTGKRYVWCNALKTRVISGYVKYILLRYMQSSSENQFEFGSFARLTDIHYDGLSFTDSLHLDNTELQVKASRQLPSN